MIAKDVETGDSNGLICVWQAAPSASPKPVKKPSGPQKVVWKWEAEKEAWKLEQVQKNDPSEAFRTAAAQVRHTAPAFLPPSQALTTGVLA